MGGGASKKKNQSQEVSQDFKITGIVFLGQKTYELGKFLGRGAFGEVNVCRIKNEEILYALKKISLEESKYDPQFLPKTMTEVANMINLKHQNIINLIDYHVENDNLYLRMELANYGNLSTYLNEQLQKGIEQHLINMEGAEDNTLKSELLRLFLEICKAIEFCHKQNLVHRDIKPKNVLLFINNKTQLKSAKIGDFGLSKFEKKSYYINPDTLRGTQLYVSPEMYEIMDKQVDLKNVKIRYKCTDIWALGITLYEIMCLRKPFLNKKQILEGVYDDQQVKDQNVKLLIGEMLQRNQEKRIKISEVVQKVENILDLLTLEYQQQQESEQLSAQKSLIIEEIKEDDEEDDDTVLFRKKKKQEQESDLKSQIKEDNVPVFEEHKEIPENDQNMKNVQEISQDYKFFEEKQTISLVDAIKLFKKSQECKTYEQAVNWIKQNDSNFSEKELDSVNKFFGFRAGLQSMGGKSEQYKTLNLLQNQHFICALYLSFPRFSTSNNESSSIIVLPPIPYIILLQTILF